MQAPLSAPKPLWPNDGSSHHLAGREVALRAISEPPNRCETTWTGGRRAPSQVERNLGEGEELSVAARCGRASAVASRSPNSPSAFLVEIELILTWVSILVWRPVGGHRYGVLGVGARRWSCALPTVMRNHDGREIGLKIGGDGVIASVAREQHGLSIVPHAHRVPGIVPVARRSIAALQFEAAQVERARDKIQVGAE